MSYAIIYGNYVGGRKIVAYAATRDHLLMMLEVTGLHYDGIE